MAQALDADKQWIPEDTFGGRLARLRQALGGWNIRRAAQHCGVSPESWRSWEKGVSPQQMDQVAKKIAAATGADYLWLLAGEAIRTGSR